MNRIVRDIPRPAPAIIQQLLAAPTTAFVGGPTFGAGFAMDPAIRPIRESDRICGPAFTARPDDVDHLIPMYAATLAKPGDVLVVDAGGRTDVSVWGAGMTHTAMQSGVVGVIVDGTVVDRASIARLPIPVYARGSNPTWSTWELPGSINVPVRCGGLPVAPGDIIHADADGVIVIPRDRLAEAVQHARWWVENMAVWRAGIAEGKSFFAILGLQATLDRLGIPEETGPAE
ncbi:MAG: RraA family protein [Dehalococcoidia bacterium]|nr:RraA family protein [Dehalococcoidia bacterium]